MRATQASDPPAGMNVIPLGEELKDFADTAALLANLDLLISVDTSVVHLAGARARPVWTLLAAGPDWRWVLGRSDSPRYPTMRLFRQPQPGARIEGRDAFRATAEVLDVGAFAMAVQTTRNQSPPLFSGRSAVSIVTSPKPMTKGPRRGRQSATTGVDAGAGHARTRP